MDFVYEIGVSPRMNKVWSVIGVITAFAAALEFTEKHASTLSSVAMATTAAAIGAVMFAGASRLRDKNIMRNRANYWAAKMLVNDLVSVVTIGVAVLRGNSDRSIYGQVYLAISVFSLLEIAKPTFDFGVLQFFLRLPVISCVLGYFGDGTVGIAELFGCIMMLLILTAWNSFYLSVFESKHYRSLVDDAARG